jgi:hypothetical protein
MITDYTTLKEAVADWLNRADLTTQIPTFIQLAEAKFNRELRVRDMLVRAEASSDEGYIPMPTDFLQEYSMKLETDTPHQEIVYVGADEAKKIKATGLTGAVQFYSIVGGTFELIPDPVEPVDVEMVYYAKIPALSDSATTNWLLSKSPDLYLYGALLETVPYLKDDERLQTWFGARQQIMDGMSNESERSMRSSTQLNMRMRSFG